MLLRCTAVVFAILMSLAAKGQHLRGTITDSQNKPVPFSTVFIKELSFGTAANEEGYFELAVEEGTYTCVFQCMGYQTVVRSVSVNGLNEPLSIVLPEMIYSLREVEVSDGSEDPAYRLMRKVIRKAPLYAGMVKSYKADVYIRGSLNIRRISAMVKLMARDDLKESNIREGNTYVEESVNEIEYTAPDKVRQKVKSIHSTFPGGNESRGAGAMGYISGNIYLPGAFGNARSPLAPGAFRYYRFVYEGVSVYGNVVVDKIRVIPKGSGPQFVSGTLYIIEDLWCIYSLDIQIDEQLGMTINLRQFYGEVREGAWLPVNNRFTIDADLLGNSGGFTYNTSIRYRSLEVNPPDSRAVKSSVSGNTGAAGKKSRFQSRIDKLEKQTSGLESLENPSTTDAYRSARLNHRKAVLLRKDSLRHEHTYVENYKTVFDSNARKTDSAFWNSIRPIPLAANEIKSIKAFDSLEYRKVAGANDSLKVSGRKTAGSILFGGKIAPDTLQYLMTEGLLNPFGISYNTVDGFAYRLHFGYHRTLKNKSSLTATFGPGYAFSRKSLFWKAGIGYVSNGRFRNAVKVNLGSGSHDFNSAGGAAPLENSIASLFFRQNLMRLYNRDFIEVQHLVNPWPVFRIRTTLSVAESRELVNNSDFSFFYGKEREFKPNIPGNQYYRFGLHRDYTGEITLSYKAMPYYVIRDGIRIPRPGMNQTPEISIGWKKGLPLGGLASDFDLIHAGLAHRFRTGLNGSIGYQLNAGYFLNTKRIFFDDFVHFQSQPLVTGIKSYFPVVQMGDYYRYSTEKHYFEGHFEYRTPHLLLKKLPLVRNRLWEESLLLNYLYTPQYRHCVEFGYGIGNYFYNIGFFAGFETGKFRSAGLRISIPVLSKNEVVIGL